MSIELRQISKKFSNFVALSPTDLTINDGEMVALLGASGSGKTTLLRLIAGLETADSGQILINQRDVSQTAVKDRNIGFVFQHYALFKHLKVVDNIAFGLSVKDKRSRLSKAQQRLKALQLLEMVQLQHLADRYPSNLSGGQQQRVALARALAIEPSVILFDEPFGALDIKVRRDLRLWLKSLQKDLKFTGVFVTHDQEEALDLADRICIMKQGKIMQTDDAATLYNQPANVDVFRFMSDVHEWPVEIKGQLLDLGGVGGNTWVKSDLPLNSRSGFLAIRNQELGLSERPLGGVQMPVKLINLDMLGTQYRLTLKTEGWGNQDLWHILLPVQSFKVLPIIGKRYYLSPKQAYLIDEQQKVNPLLHDLSQYQQEL